jgi:Outer membrane protein beta-barrel domain
MKKTILLFAAVTSISLTIAAQDGKTNNDKNFHFGIKGGINISNVYDSKGEDFVAKAKAGIAIGAFVQIPIGNVLGIQPEVLYSQKGFKGKGTILGNPYSYTRTTDYLDIPILLAIKPVKMLTIVAGPQYSFLLREKNVFENTLFTSIQEEEFNNDNVRKNTLCFLGGADINFDNLVLSGRAGWDVQNNAGDGSNNTPRYKNVWYQATIGFRF